jgi:hypothetical protein
MQILSMPSPAMVIETNTDGKELSNPFSTGGGGTHFENQIQTLYVILMLTGGFVPSLPALPIKRIKLQGKYAGYNTDDFIAFVEDQNGERTAKLLAQIKHSLSITENDGTFAEVIVAAWLDYQTPALFNRETDVFALITGPLSATDGEVRTLLDWARSCETAEEFFKKVELAKFSNDTKRAKLKAFRTQLKNANNKIDVGDETFWKFLKCFHLLGYDLDLNSGVTLSLLKSQVAHFTTSDASAILALVANEVASFDQAAGTLTRETISAEVGMIFAERLREIPAEYTKPSEADLSATERDYSKGEHGDALMFASLAGAWNEKVGGDRDVIRKLIEGDD